MRSFPIILLCAALISACQSAPTLSPQASPTAEPTGTSPTAALPPAPTSVPTIESSPTAAQPTAAKLPTETVSPALNELPQQMVWLPEGAQAPGISAGGPLLIAKLGSTLYPFQPEPLQPEPPVSLNIPGQTLALAPDLQSVLARGADGSMGVYDLTGRLLYAFDEPNPYFASYTEDGKTITLNSAGTWGIIIYDAATGERLKTLTGFETAAPVYGGGLVPGGRTAYWIARATLQLQDVESGQMGVAFKYQDFIESMTFSTDGSRLALSVSEKIYLYSVPDGKELAQISRSQPVQSLQFSPDGKLLAAGYGPGVQIWDGSTLMPVTSFPGPNEFTGRVAFSPGGAYLAAAHDGGQITVHRIER